MVTYLKEKNCKNMEDINIWSKNYTHTRGNKQFYYQNSNGMDNNYKKRYQKDYVKENRDQPSRDASPPPRKPWNGSRKGGSPPRRPWSQGKRSPTTNRRFGNRSVMEKDHKNPYRGENREGCPNCGGPHKPWRCPEKKKQEVAQALKMLPPPEGATKGKWKTVTVREAVSYTHLTLPTTFGV